MIPYIFHRFDEYYLTCSNVTFKNTFRWTDNEGFSFEDLTIRKNYFIFRMFSRLYVPTSPRAGISWIIIRINGLVPSRSLYVIIHVRHGAELLLRYGQILYI